MEISGTSPFLLKYLAKLARILEQNDMGPCKQRRFDHDGDVQKGQETLRVVRQALGSIGWPLSRLRTFVIWQRF